jgi:ABC-type transport system substrate-binding protein
MDVTTAQLYDVLVEKGFDKSRVREALSEIVSKKEMNAHIERGFDRVRAELKIDMRATENRLIMWVIGVQIAGTGLLLASKLFA